MHLTVRDETEINCDTLGSASHWRLGLFCGRCGVAGEDRFSGAQRLLAALLLDGTGGAWFCPTHTFLFLHGRFLFGSLRSFRFLFRLLWDRDAFRSSTSRFAPSPSPWIFRFLFWLSSFCSLRSFIFFAPSLPGLGSFLFHRFLASLPFLVLADHVIKGKVDVDRIFNAHFGESEEGHAVRMFRVRWLFRWLGDNWDGLSRVGVCWSMFGVG